MKIKTSELTGPALDWAVAKCQIMHVADGKAILVDDLLSRVRPGAVNNYSTQWASGGPIIERERLGIMAIETNWIAKHPYKTQDAHGTGLRTIGPTPLIAAMRCYVASKLGDEVDVPGELT